MLAALQFKYFLVDHGLIDLNIHKLFIQTVIHQHFIAQKHKSAYLSSLPN